MLLHEFSIIKIINLAYRTDRKAEMIEEMSRIGLSSSHYSFFDAFSANDGGVFGSRGAMGCYQSHLAILEDAKRRDEKVLILEDDCDFADGIFTYQLPDDWDVFYGGYEPSNTSDIHSGGVIGSHFMAFSAEAVKKLVPYLRRLPDVDFPVDHQAMSETGYNPDRRPGIDGAYVWFRRAHPELKTVFANPPLGYQRASRTDIAPNKFFDRLPVLRTLITLARKIRRRIR